MSTERIWFTTSKGGLGRLDEKKGCIWFVRPEEPLRDAMFHYVQQDATEGTKTCDLTAAGGNLEWD